MAQEIDWLPAEKQPEWDAFVANHQRGWVTHLAAWKECLEESFHGIQGRFLVIRDPLSHAIVAGMPVYEVWSPLKGKRLVSIPFATRCDPLTSSPDQLSLLVEYLHGRRVEVRSTDGSCSALQNLGFGVSTEYKQHTISLDRGIDAIYNSFHRSCVRQRIARAEREGLRPSRGDCLADLATFYRLYTKTRKLLGLPALPWSFFHALWERLFPRRMIELFLVRAQERSVASVLTFRFGGRVSAECLGWDREFAAVGATSSVFWSAIQDAHQQGFRAFDFGRTAASSTSLLDFKRRWGATESDLPVWYYPAADAMRDEDAGISPSRALFKSLSARMPVRIYRIMSNIVYRLMA